MLFPSSLFRFSSDYYQIWIQLFHIYCNQMENLKCTEPLKGTWTCFHWKKIGHLAKYCKRPAVGSRPEFKCYHCWKPGHISSNCHQKKFSAAGAATEEHQDFVGTTSPTEELQDAMGLCGARSIIATENKSQQFDTTLECIHDDHLLLANGKSLSLVMALWLGGSEFSQHLPLCMS